MLGRTWLVAQRRSLESRRLPVRLLAAQVAVLVAVVSEVFAVQSRYLRRSLSANELAGLRESSLWALAVGVGFAVPALYLAGGRASTGRLGAAENQVARDSLTGLRNHASFQESLRHEVARARRFREAFTLVLVDVDDFGFVNDSLGRRKGDEILVGLTAALRAGRTVDHLFRVGGDEFAVIMPHTSLDDAVLAVARLRQRAERHLHGTTVSVGLAEFDPTGVGTDKDTDAAVLRSRVEVALAEAKRRGRNEVATFTEIVESAPRRTSAATITAVRRLLTGRQMGAAFQPIWNLDTHRVIGYEGLARPSVEYGLAGPRDAFSGAARLGRVGELDALCRASVLAGAGDLPADVLLFLNVAPEVFDGDATAGRQIAQEVQAAGLPAGHVVIEFSATARDLLDLVQVRELRDLGFHLALDDVDDARLLGDLRPDYVKVDRDVVCSAREGGSGRAVLAAVVAYAARSGAVVIARGIETEELLGHLVRAARTVSKRARFVGGQGYLLGRPDPGPWRNPTATTWPLRTLSLEGSR